MIFLLATPAWIALVVLTLTVCASTRLGDLNQEPAEATGTERSPRLSLPEAPAEYGRPSAGDARRVAA